MAERTPQRKERRDKKAPGEKLTCYCHVKLKPGEPDKLDKQAAAAGFDSKAKYIRDLATKDRERLKLGPHDYNEGL
jgi:hypothetical protein